MLSSVGHCMGVGAKLSSGAMLAAAVPRFRPIALIRLILSAISGESSPSVWPGPRMPRKSAFTSLIVSRGRMRGRPCGRAAALAALALIGALAELRPLPALAQAQAQ